MKHNYDFNDLEKDKVGNLVSEGRSDVYIQNSNESSKEKILYIYLVEQVKTFHCH